jgi:hypothetical protein
MPKDCANYEPVAWWFTRSRLGRSLRERYEGSTDMPPNLRALVSKLGPQSKRLDTNASAIDFQEVLIRSAQSIAELDAPAPSDYSGNDSTL